MEIELKNCGKSFNRKWLFKDLTCTLKSGEFWAILGANGSGKSTLSLMLCGQVWPTEGEISWSKNNALVDRNKVFSQVSLTAPAMELPEEFSLAEIVVMHAGAKPMLSTNPLQELMELCEFNKNVLEKPFMNFSSGMKQRVKLALAAMSDSPLLVMDEPLTNLDKSGAVVYENIVNKYSKNRIVVIASNREDEYKFCDKFLRILPGGVVALNQELRNS